MLIDPAIKSSTRQFVQRVTRSVISRFSKYEKIISSKNSENNAFELRSDNKIYDLKPWRQDFAKLGIRTRFDDYKKPYIENIVDAIRLLIGKPPLQSNGAFINQIDRDRIILPALDHLFGKVLSKEKNLSFLDTFCNAGFYSYYVAEKFANVSKIVGVELDPVPYSQGCVINECFKISDKVILKKRNVFDLSPNEIYDVTLCVGGLYHVDSPSTLIKILTGITKKFMIVHSVIVWDENKPDNFIISPAPGLKHGSRFSYSYLKKCLLENHWEIIDEGTHVVPTIFNDMWSGRWGWFVCKK